MMLDNTSANTIAITLIKLKLDAHRDELLHQHCICHIINLIVKSGEKIIDVGGVQIPNRCHPLVENCKIKNNINF